MPIGPPKPANDADNTLIDLRKTVARIEGYQPELATGEAEPMAFGWSRSTARCRRAGAGGAA
jgi:hypothetical protein